MTCLNEYCFATCRAPRLNIAPFVTNQKRRGKIDIIPFPSLEKHTGFWFSAPAVNTIFLHFCFGMMRTIIDCIDAGTGLFEQSDHSPVKYFYVFLLVKSFCDAGLIGDNDHLEFFIIQHFYRRTASLYQCELVNTMGVMRGILCNNPIPIKENCFIRIHNAISFIQVLLDIS